MSARCLLRTAAVLESLFLVNDWRPGRDRRVVIMGWAASATRWASPHGPLLSEAHAARLEAAGRMTPTLRSLTGQAFEG